MSVHSLFFQSTARSFANLSLKPRTENFPFVCVYISCCSSFQFSSDKVKALVSYWIWKFAVVFLYGQDRLYITHWYVLVNLLSGPLFGSGFIHILAKYFFRGMKLVLIQITRYRAQSIDHGVATFMKVKQPAPLCRDVMEIRNGLLSGATSFMDFFSILSLMILCLSCLPSYYQLTSLFQLKDFYWFLYWDDNVN